MSVSIMQQSVMQQLSCCCRDKVAVTDYLVISVNVM
jgi:hypothetical protein